MNGSLQQQSRPGRKARPDVELYRPGAFRQAGISKNSTENRSEDSSSQTPAVAECSPLDNFISACPEGLRHQRNYSIDSIKTEESSQSDSDSSSEESSCISSSSFISSGLTLEEIMKGHQNFMMMDWSQLMENEFDSTNEAQQEEREDEDGQNYCGEQSSEEQQKMPLKTINQTPEVSNSDENRVNIEDLKTGEKVSTSTMCRQSFNPRILYQRTRAAQTSTGQHEMDKNLDRGGHYVDKKRDHPKGKQRGYKGEHDDRYEVSSENVQRSRMTSGRLSGRITFLQK